MIKIVGRFLRIIVLTLSLCSLFHASHVVAEEISDPLEGFNRGVFWFNNKFDKYLAEPLAEGYDAVLPEFVQDGIGNVFSNLRYPSYLVSDLIQLKFPQVLNHTGRFLINSTFGLGGFFDVAKHMGLKKHYEDFGVALAYHDIPAGPYIVIPFLGPSTLRDGFGRAVDAFLDPVYWVAYETAADNDAFMISAGSTALDLLDQRASVLEAVKAAKEASLDYYLFIQSSYYQYRSSILLDKMNEEGEYDEFEDEFDDEFDDDLEN